MKHIKLYLIIIFTVMVLVCGCTDLSVYVPVEKYDNKVLELEEANSKTEAKSIEILELKKELNILENDQDLTEEELEQYKNLLNNLNDLLSNVYYGYAENENWILDGFTAFSIKYGERYYILTAGHCVEDKDGRYYNHRFKANFTNEFIYPKLLAYENDFYGNKDYAIFYSDKIDSGLDIDHDNDYPRFILGTTNNDLNVLRKNNQRGKDGECGSPAIDLGGEVVGIFRGRITPMGDVIKAIDNLE